MTPYNQLEEMIQRVARALGPDLLHDVVFVGGCTTGLHISDDASKDDVRYTDDVDLIINVMSYVSWTQFCERLTPRGFRVSMEDTVNCRLRLGELKVDFMPDDEAVLGFSNRWYKDAFSNAQNFALADGTVIKLITPPYFVATKLEAYRGRGNNDPLSSHDLEDILNLFDGRPTLPKELAQSPPNLKRYIAENMTILLQHPSFQYAVQSAAKGSIDRQNLIFNRLALAANLK